MPDAYEKTATALLNHITRGIPSLDLCLISQSGDCLDFGGCVDHATKVLIGLLRENIPTSTIDPGATYPLKAAEMMAEYIAIDPSCSCPKWAEDWECEACRTVCKKTFSDCWLQYFREKAEEGKK